MRKIKDINQGDIIAFKANDENFKALICTSVYKDKSPQIFIFAALNYERPVPPTLDDILKCNFWGTGNTKNDHFKYPENELNNMWLLHPDIKPYFLGSYGLTIWRKDLIKFRNDLEYIGNLSIVNNLDKNGNGSMNASDWTFLKDFFTQKFKSILADRGQKQFFITAILTTTNSL